MYFPARRLTPLLVAVISVVGLQAAAGAAAESTTENSHGEITFYDVKPCSTDGIAYEIVANVNAIEHESENPNGGHFTFTETGRFTARPVVVERDADGNPVYDEEEESLIPTLDGDGNVQYLDGETFNGHYTVWGGGNQTRGGQNSTFTFSVTGRGSEGSAFKENATFHFTAAPGQDPFEDPSLLKVIFEHDRCH
jgi:hypothetical protein